MEFYTNFAQMEMCTNSRISPSESDSSNSTATKPRHVVNARERCRTQSFSSVNSAFNTLRTLIPTEPYDRKLSKIEILRLAKSYIAHLDAVIVTGNNEKPCSIYSREVHHQCNNERITESRTAICTFCANNFNKS
ncbi:transcription factor 15 isoform X1 [Lucilia sericata]|uniref:transcription factor 15 isoform X1 n=1 Tax=Lucilia sericata TaxID=13632 RepID=UPI0018A7F0ED|nr:transcription factor 15 isoform X1 [Lucilia sericata]